MSRERHRKLSDLFARAGRLPPDARVEFLENACGEDAELLSEVLSLLEEERVGPLDTEHVRAKLGRVAEDVIGSPGHPESIGHYRIIRVIGQGGMGVVYEAEQDNPRRRVALKVIRPGQLDPTLLARFRHEVQVLGQLQHPGIARIYEAGSTDVGAGGQPHFAMELVHGRPLLDYAEENELDLHQRLELMAKICDALQHAHRKGVIHRDLKPANILVEQGGVPKILDFGVARATGADLHTVSVRTQMGQIIGTVPYMSPEQAGGDPAELDTRSDVYGVGVIAYELLAGRLPYDVKDRLIHEAVRVIREDEPTRLSAVNASYRGDVETIIAKALEKDKDRRYQSASAMANDLRRYLNHEVITARPPSTLYQLRKFTQRNRALVASAGVVFAVLVVATVVSTTLAIREGRARQAESAQRTLAEDARDEAEAVSAFLRNMIGAANPWAEEAGFPLGRNIKIVDVLDNAATELDTSFGGQPEVEAAVRGALGETYQGIGQFDEAESHLLRAVGLLAERLGPSHEKTLNARGALAALYYAQGRLEEAETLGRQVVEARRSVAGDDDQVLIEDLTSLGNVLRDLGKYDEAEVLLREALERAGTIPAEQANLEGDILNELALTVHYKGDYEGAEPLFRKALALTRQQLGPEHPRVAIALHNLASLLHDQGHYAAAESMYREALDMRVKLLGEEHPETLITMNNLGLLYDNEGRFDEAEPLYVRVLEIRTRILGENNWHTLSSVYNLGVFYRNTDQLEKAEPMLVKAMDGFLNLLGEGHLYTFTSMAGLAILYDDQGRLEEAEQLFRRTLRLRRKELGDEHPDTLRAAGQLAGLLLKRGRNDEAEMLFAEAVAGARKALPEGHRHTAGYLRGHGRALLKLERYDEAETALLEAHELSEKAHGPADGRTVQAIEALVEVYEARGDRESAVAWRSMLNPPSPANDTSSLRPWVRETEPDERLRLPKIDSKVALGVVQVDPFREKEGT